MSRWYVYKETEGRSRQWVAIPAREKWWERPQGRRFPAWEMAVRYANRMNLTAPPEPIVKLAKPDELAKTLSELGYRRATIKDPSGAVCALTATVNERNHIHLKSGDDTFTLARHEWKPLARFLLNAANQAEEA